MSPVKIADSAASACAGVIDVVMGEDHPLEILGVESSLGEEAKDSPEAAGVARVHDGESLGALIEISLSAPNPRDPLDHTPIIGVLDAEALRSLGRASLQRQITVPR